MSNNSDTSSDSLSAISHLKILETIVQNMSKSGEQLAEENRNLRESNRKLEQKYCNVFNENKRLAEECERMAKRLKRFESIDRKDSESQTNWSSIESSVQTIDDDNDLKCFRNLNFTLNDKTIIGCERSDILCEDSSEETDLNCDDFEDQNSDKIDEDIDEVPESLDESTDNKERNDCDFDDIEVVDEVHDSFDGINDDMNGIEFVDNNRQNIVRNDSKGAKSEENMIICLDSESEVKTKKSKPNYNDFSEGKVIKVNKNNVNIKTLVADKYTTSPIKLKVKTLGPVVRNREERKKLNGFTCKECEDYYRTKNLSEEELKKRLKECSRHRAHHSPNRSPEHFWETDFPSTPECIKRGIFNIDNSYTPNVTQRKAKPKPNILPDFFRADKQNKK